MKIRLILIGQTHRPPSLAKDHKDVKFDSSTSSQIVYSQLKIMQLVMLYPEAAILSEGNMQNLTPSDWCDSQQQTLKKTFPKNIEALDFNKLNFVQKMTLYDNLGVQLLFQLRLITHIYQAADKEIKIQPLMEHYIKTSRDRLPEFPRLFVQSLLNSVIPDSFDIMPEDSDEYEAYKSLVRRNNPKFFYEREKEALDFAIRTAQSSKRSQVILIMGRNHLPGLTALVEEEYGDKIVLEQTFDSLNGFLFPKRENQLKAEEKYALEAYRSENYREAKKFYQKSADFLKAAPLYTPGREKNLLSAEYNLGSSILKLIENDETVSSYSEAVEHLKNAYKIADARLKSDKDKYFNRYFQACQRGQRKEITSFFSSSTPQKIPGLISEYAELDPEELKKASPKK